ncbi:MAG TPA: CocE/NonD family hydrolase [Rhizomicrobium sp.]
MTVLAKALVRDYREKDEPAYLDNLFRLQIVAQDYAGAAATIGKLRALRMAAEPSPQIAASDIAFEIYANAMARRGTDFPAAFATEFRALIGPMDERTSALAVRMFNAERSGGLSLIIDQTALKKALDGLLEKQKKKTTITLSDALALVRAYQIEAMYRAVSPYAPPLVAEDDERRYIIMKHVPVTTPDGAIVCADIFRPRAAKGRLVSLLEFSIYADELTATTESRRSASNGYAGVAGFSRGKLCSLGEAVPAEHDGVDADALIEWIARQNWSDGRVGMFGASYDGFTQWAALKHPPRALKTIMPQVTFAPGIDVPMEGSIPQTFSYYWPLYVATNKTLNGAAFEDQAHWSKLFGAWYKSGRAYSDLSAMDGRPNPIWDRWISHPGYDAYWQSMIPFAGEFARIRIPVLTTTGYFDGGEIGALYYFGELDKYLPRAEHYLVVGPFDHGTGNRGPIDIWGNWRTSLNGYTLDPAALIDLGVLRYQWFDYVFRNAPRPALLKDKVNYEVMGANAWRHESSIAAMSARQMPLYLTSKPQAGHTLLLDSAPGSGPPTMLRVDFRDRSDVDRVPAGGNILDDAIDTWLGLEFVSAPFANPATISGLFSGTLDFTVNKRDFDFAIQLYEKTAQGKYLQLAWYMVRASYAADRSRRQLLVPGRRQQLRFTAGRLMGRRIDKGSRLVVVLSAFRQPNVEINYGTGKTVSEETIADAKDPLVIDWFGDSVIDMPIGK